MYWIAVDPGTTESAFVVMDDDRLTWTETLRNESLLQILKSRPLGHLVVEGIASYGRPVGAEVFETCIWIGRFIESSERPHTLVYRMDVKRHLCPGATNTVKDAVIRQRLIDLYGGKEKAIGKAKSPGPLYRVKGDAWSALAVARTWWERKRAIAQ